MSATIEQFPVRRTSPAEVQRRRCETNAMRYVSRAEEAFQLLAAATTELERDTLCEIAEAWLDLAEASLPIRA